MEFIDLADISEVPLGRAKAYDVNGRRIALYHTAQGFFATDNTCPHRGGPLAEGDLIGNEIHCPWHLWGFDVSTGFCGGDPDGMRVVAHQVQVEGERVMVRLS
jgi:nitrite reductase/ring-hydroxylating ferredoxin subunit